MVADPIITVASRTLSALSSPSNHAAGEAILSQMPPDEARELRDALSELTCRGYAFESPQCDPAADGLAMLGRLSKPSNTSDPRGVIYLPSTSHGSYPWRVESVEDLKHFAFAETNRIDRLPPGIRDTLNLLDRLRNGGVKFYSSGDPKMARLSIAAKMPPVWYLMGRTGPYSVKALWASVNGSPRQPVTDLNAFARNVDAMKAAATARSLAGASQVMAHLSQVAVNPLRVP